MIFYIETFRKFSMRLAAKSWRLTRRQKL